MRIFSDFLNISFWRVLFWKIFLYTFDRLKFFVNDINLVYSDSLKKFLKLRTFVTLSVENKSPPYDLSWRAFANIVELINSHIFKNQLHHPWEKDSVLRTYFGFFGPFNIARWRCKMRQISLIITDFVENFTQLILKN